jgi:hypothetical protein
MMLRACDNPFAVHRVLRERYRLDETEWSQLFARLESQQNRGALVGPRGAGKTTLLEDLAERLEARRWKIILLQLSAERDQFALRSIRERVAHVGATDFVLLDGAEQLGPIAWWRFSFWTRRAGGIVVTSHRAGRLPLLRRCETSSSLLRELVSSLGVEISPAESDALHARHRGNLRDALRELYDHHSCRPTIRGFSSSAGVAQS